MHCCRQKNSRIVRDFASAIFGGMNLRPHACLLLWHILPCLRLGRTHATQVSIRLDMTCKPKTRLLTNRECPARASGPAERSVALILRSLTAKDKLLCPVCGCDSHHSETARSPEIVCDRRFDLGKHGSISASTCIESISVPGLSRGPRNGAQRTLQVGLTKVPLHKQASLRTAHSCTPSL